MKSFPKLFSSNKTRLVLGIIISLGAFFLAIQGVDLRFVWRTILDARIEYILLALTCVALTTLAKTFRWKLLVGSKGKSISTSSRLRISKIKDKTPASGKGLLALDEIIKAEFVDGSVRRSIDSDALLEQIAKAEEGQAVLLTAEHDNGLQETVTIELDEPLGYRLYAGPARWFLSSLVT